MSPYRRRARPLASPLAEKLTCPNCHRATVQISSWPFGVTLACDPCYLVWHGVADYEAACDIARRRVHSPAPEPPKGAA